MGFIDYLVLRAEPSNITYPPLIVFFSVLLCLHYFKRKLNEDIFNDNLFNTFYYKFLQIGLPSCPAHMHVAGCCSLAQPGPLMTAALTLPRGSCSPARYHPEFPYNPALGTCRWVFRSSLA